MDNYFSFNAATENAADEDGNRSRNNRSEVLDSNNSNILRDRSPNGHPLVPRLNLPRTDPNDQWREMMAQA